jgi:hypothetical protein
MSFPRESSKSIDDIENLLRAFYRHEMPASWPTPELTSPPPVQIVSGRPLRRSRAALAASLLILMAGPIFLSGKFMGYTPQNDDRESGRFEATGPKSRFQRQDLTPKPDWTGPPKPFRVNGDIKDKQ